MIARIEGGIIKRTEFIGALLLMLAIVGVITVFGVDESSADTLTEGGVTYTLYESGGRIMQ